MTRATSIRAAMVAAAIYGYFLLFAQFAFVEILRGAGHDERPFLSWMALCGVGTGFVAAWKSIGSRGIAGAMLACAAAAALSHVHSAAALWAAAGLAGAGLGVATVSYAANARAWCGIIGVAVGTGLGYAVCNLPSVFLTDASAQGWMAAAMAAFAVPLVHRLPCGWRTDEARLNSGQWVWLVAAMMVLVWLDSAAFFIIQHAGELREGTWGAAHLWRNAAVHLLGAVGSGLLLQRFGARSVLAVACAILAFAGHAVNHPDSLAIAGAVYPAGVSLYSVPLVVCAGWFAGAEGPRAAAWRAAWLFAIAGWFGSANGIGMVKGLRAVPDAFVAVACTVVAWAWASENSTRWRPLMGLVAVAALVWFCGIERTPSMQPHIEAGRRVYLSEGCIHCHSQYPRPGSWDEVLWDRAPDSRESLASEPVLIGNRRHGPDLTNIGARRSPEWLREHFIDPRAFSPDSNMPSYAHLFRDGRGDALVSWLANLGRDRVQERIERAAVWNPQSTSEEGNATSLYVRNCAVCHGAQGLGDGRFARKFTRAPANLVDGPFIWTGGSDARTKAARVIKWGLPGTPMPGHETMLDGEINALSRYLMEMRSAKVTE